MLFLANHVLQWLRTRLKQRILCHFLVLVLIPAVLIIGWNSLAQPFTNSSHPQVILISLDGAAKERVEEYLSSGILSPDVGLGLIKSQGIYADKNITCTPSLTAACHLAIATGSTAVKNDITSNKFHLVASPLNKSISGFSAPIGGYSLLGPAESITPTAQPLWVNLRAHGKKVVTATFPGGDGMEIKVPGLPHSPIIQSSSQRTGDYTVPFGASAEITARGFSLTSSDFSNAPQTTVNQLNLAGKVSYSQIQQASLNDNFTVGNTSYSIQVAAIDTTNDRQINYDTLVFFDAKTGIQPEPFTLPETGPAYVTPRQKKSSPFYLQGSSNQAGTAFYVSYMGDDLSNIHIARYSANYIPVTPAVASTVNDIYSHVGFWRNQPDYRFPERLNPGLSNFSDAELQAIYEDQVESFIDYQTRLALRAIEKNPTADLVMIYFEQPDGSEHQFLLTDPRQATDPQNPQTILAGQDIVKISRYRSYIETAYRTANNAVQKIIDLVGKNPQGVPNSNIIVVSDHGFSTFHTTVNLTNYLNTYLANQGFTQSQISAVQAYTSGPVAHIYINLAGREPGGTIDSTTYNSIQKAIVKSLNTFVDGNLKYGSGHQAVFDKIYVRPLPDGKGTNSYIAQDSGDVFAILSDGYNFDGIQTPAVTRLGDTSSAFFSVPNFYGAHGYDSEIPKLSAIFYAAGPDISRRGSVGTIHNIDIAPTINSLLRVPSAKTVQGKAVRLTP